jgi:hypothetical protein
MTSIAWTHLVLSQVLWSKNIYSPSSVGDLRWERLSAKFCELCEKTSVCYTCTQYKEDMVLSVQIWYRSRELWHFAMHAYKISKTQVSHDLYFIMLSSGFPTPFLQKKLRSHFMCNLLRRALDQRSQHHNTVWIISFT